MDTPYVVKTITAMTGGPPQKIDLLQQLASPHGARTRWRSRQNRHFGPDQSLKLPHQPKERLCRVNAISAGSPTNVGTKIYVYLEPLDQGRSRAVLADGTILAVSRQPFLDAARALGAAGHAPEVLLIGCRKGEAGWSLRAPLGVAEKLTVDESKTCFALWKPFPPSAVGSPVRFSDEPATPQPITRKAVPGGPRRVFR
jgi:hypothetical protein